MVYTEKMDKAIDALENDFGTIRAGRANPHMLDKLKIDYYGTLTGIQGVANVSVPDARTLMITPWEPKMVKDIEKVIVTTILALHQTTMVRTSAFSQLEMTEERRKDLAKDIKKKGEDAKVAIRNARRDANDEAKKLNKAGELSR